MTLRVPVPTDLLDEAERRARILGIDSAIILGDLVADALPDALAEAARQVLASQQPPDAATPPTLVGGASGLTSPQDLADAIVPGDGYAPEPGDAGPP